MLSFALLHPSSSSSSPNPQFHSHFHFQNQISSFQSFPFSPFTVRHLQLGTLKFQQCARFWKRLEPVISSPFTVIPLKLLSKHSFFPLSSSSESSSSLIGDEFQVELGRLLALLPEEMRRRVSEHSEFCNLIEVVMDLGRKPLARFPSGDFILSDHPITLDDLQQATSQVKIE